MDDCAYTAMQMITKVKLCFKDAEANVRTGASVVETPVSFGELAGISENMIIGFPTLAQWGFTLDSDADGNVWVEFRKLGVTMLAERFGTPTAH